MLQNLVNETASKYDGVLKELAALLVPHLIAHPDMQTLLSGASQLVTRESVEEIVQAKLDGLGPIDKDMVREVCEEVVDGLDMDDKVNDWFTCNFDISDYGSEIRDLVDVEDQIETHLNTYLHDEVVSCIQGLTFNVEVS
jgi:uncharacterized protein YlzI (FlbEa/FlbD family)